MIESLRSWALGLCYAALCAGIVLMMTPKSETLEKSIRFATALFFLLCFFSPLARLKNIHFNEPATAACEYTLTDSSVKLNYLTQYENGLKLLIERELKGKGIEAAVTVELDIETGGRVLVNIRQGDNAAYMLAEGIIKTVFGLPAEKMTE